MLPGFPAANIKEFWLTILSEAKRPQTQYLSPEGEFWVCSETNSRMVQNSFQRAKGNVGNRPHSTETKGQGYSRIKIKNTIHSIDCNHILKLPAHRMGLPGNEISFFIVPLDPLCLSTHWASQPRLQSGACGALAGQ